MQSKISVQVQVGQFRSTEGLCVLVEYTSKYMENKGPNLDITMPFLEIT
jgi:hypothetical protein